MAETSWPFDNADTSESQFERLFAEAVGSGVGGGAIPGGSNLQVAAVSTNTVSVNVGFAVVNGFAYLNDASKNLTLTTNSSGNPRIDLIVLRRDLSANSIIATFKTGTAAATPAVPTVTQTAGGIWEIALAQVLVPSGASAPVVTDLRGYIGHRVFPYLNSLPSTAQGGDIAYNYATRQYYSWTTGSGAGGIAGWNSLNNIVQCTSTTRPTSSQAYPGMMIFENDTLYYRSWSGSAWKFVKHVGARTDASAPWGQWASNGTTRASGTGEALLIGNDYVTNRANPVVTPPTGTNSAFTVSEDGNYQIAGQCFSDTPNPGVQYFRVSVSGLLQPMTDVSQRGSGYAGSGTLDVGVGGLYHLAAGDTVSVQWGQINAGGAIVTANINLQIALIG